MRLLLVASDPMEFPGILAKTQGARQESMPMDWARSAWLGDHQLMLAANGVGWNRAAAAVDAAAGFRPDAVISTGFCGALDAKYTIAEIVVGTSVAQYRGDDPSRPASACRSYPTGNLV